MAGPGQTRTRVMQRHCRLVDIEEHLELGSKWLVDLSTSLMYPRCARWRRERRVFACCAVMTLIWLGLKRSCCCDELCCFCFVAFFLSCFFFVCLSALLCQLSKSACVFQNEAARVLFKARAMNEQNKGIVALDLHQSRNELSVHCLVRPSPPDKPASQFVLNGERLIGTR